MPRADHHAVVIGIGAYPRLEAPALDGPAQDVHRFVDWLSAPGKGDLPAENIHTVPPDTDPGIGEIDALFRPFYEAGQDARIGARLYIVAAGHGICDSVDLHSVALLTADATASDPLHVAMVKRAEWFRRHAAFDEIVLFADCCRDAPGFELTLPGWPERWSAGRAHPRASKVRYLYGFATGYGKKARERDFGAAGICGIFTETLLRALREALPDATGRVTGRRLKDHVYTIHQSVAGDARVDEPDFDDHGDEEIVFSTLPETQTHPVTVWMQPHTGRETLVVSQGAGQVARFPSASSPKVLRLVPGLYKCAIGGSDRAQLIEVPSDDECFL